MDFSLGGEWNDLPKDGWIYRHHGVVEVGYYPVQPCAGDFTCDGDVDGSDLAVFAADFGRTDCDFTVLFPDPNLETAIREAIGWPTGDIMYCDLQDLTGLTALGRGIIELEGLQYCTNLSTLQMSANQITDISALAGLVNLSWLGLDDNHITDIYPLVNNPGIGDSDYVGVSLNPLDSTS